MLEGLSTGVVVTDASRRLSQMTDEASRVLMATGTVRSDIYRQLTDWWSAADNALTQPGGLIDGALRLGQSADSEHVEVRCLDGSTKDILVSVLPLRAAGGEIIAAVVMVRDVAVARKLEADLEDCVTRLIADGEENEVGEGHGVGSGRREVHFKR